MRSVAFWIVVLLATLSSSAWAASYNKCLMPDGSIRYQEAPCHTARQSSYHKCLMEDGSIRYQEAACAGQDAGKVDIRSYAPPPPPPEAPTRQLMQATDPYTGTSHSMYVDTPMPPTSGPTRVERRMMNVADPFTGQVREMWVDVTVPIPVPPPARPRPPRQEQAAPDNSTYNAAKCRVAPNHPDCQ